MEVKTWLLIVRIINILAAILMVGFEIWFIIVLLGSDVAFIDGLIRMFTPVFVM